MSSTPRIRFIDYANDWEQRKVSDVANRFDNLRIPVAANLRIPGTTPYYGANGIQDYVEGFTHEGEFVLVAEDGANDLKNYPVKCVNGRIWVNNHAHVLQSKSDLSDNQFLAYSISQADIESLLVGGGRSKLNAEVMMGIELIIPCLQEQAAIGSYLRQLDDLITLYKRNYEKTVMLKRSMLDKMFPKSDDKAPVTRFAGFTASWKEHKIGTFTNVLSASRVHKNEWETEGVPFYRSSDVVSAYKGTRNEKAYISIPLYEELIKSSGRLEQDDLLITGGGSIGIPYLVPNSDPLYSKDADLIWIKKSDEHDSKYLYTYFASRRFRDYIHSISHSGTIAHYTIEQVKDTPVLMPEKDEQIVIGEFFFRIDTLIALYHRKLMKLKQLKQAMLHNMFV